MSLIRALWQYRAFILGSVKREFQTRYMGSLFGALWSIINPLAMVVIYTVVFAQVMKAKLPGIDDVFAYGIYLMAGILAWGYFVEVLQRCLTIFIEQRNLLKKTVFPRIALPVIVFLSATINFLIIFGIFIGFLLISGRFPGMAILSYIPLLLLQQGIALGLGILLGTLNVFFRDVGHFFGIVLQFWFWLTPIVYPVTILPDWVRSLLVSWNPLAALVNGYHNIVLTGTWPIWQDYIPEAALALILITIGYKVFRRLSAEMVDEL